MYDNIMSIPAFMNCKTSVVVEPCVFIVSLLYKSV